MRAACGWVAAPAGTVHEKLVCRNWTAPAAAPLPHRAQARVVGYCRRRTRGRRCPHALDTGAGPRSRRPSLGANRPHKETRRHGHLADGASMRTPTTSVVAHPLRKYRCRCRVSPILYICTPPQTTLFPLDLEEYQYAVGTPPLPGSTRLCRDHLPLPSALSPPPPDDPREPRPPPHLAMAAGDGSGGRRRGRQRRGRARPPPGATRRDHGGHPRRGSLRGRRRHGHRPPAAASCPAERPARALPPPAPPPPH